MSQSPPLSTAASDASSSSASGGSPFISQDRIQREVGEAPRVYSSATSRDILLFLVAFRILNALCVRTFFQPDEYFQSLEPAWQIAFGEGSGAWITWEWRHHLRSSIHPYIFAAVYWISARISGLLQLTPTNHAELLVVAPKVLQACIAACGDYYTWKLGERVYGQDSKRAWATLALTVCSAWQWFCSTRTLSNCLETTLTIIALESWPWKWSLKVNKKHVSDKVGIDGTEQKEDDSEDSQDMIRSDYSIVVPDGKTESEIRLQRCLLLAALACIMRPTNILIWICLAMYTLIQQAGHEEILSSAKFRLPLIISKTWPTLRNNRKERLILVKEIVLCGTLVIFISLISDRMFYKEWTFPPYHFLHFNIAQSLAVFYGRNRWDYYLTEGLPLLLTTYLPFGLVGIYQGLNASQHDSKVSAGGTIRVQLAMVAVVFPLILSVISHKEVRFIYPLLPILHILSAYPITSFSQPAHSRNRSSWSAYRPTLLPSILLINILIAIFTTQYHQPAPLSVMDYLRREHEKHYLTQPPALAHLPAADTAMTVGFLMPCHSTPWRSHLVHPGIKAWALGCEPPVHLDLAERADYLDEADQFYASPISFLESNLGKPKSRKTKLGQKRPQAALGSDLETGSWDGKPGKKVWPEYLVFFEGLEHDLAAVTRDSGYGECWRGWNSYFHDDWRRTGDIVVWCLRTRDGWRGGTGGLLLGERQRSSGLF